MWGAHLSPISARSPGSDLGFSILVLAREARSVLPRPSLHLTSTEKIWWVPDVWCGGGGTHGVKVCPLGESGNANLQQVGFGR